MPELLELSLLVSDVDEVPDVDVVLDVALVAEVLGTAYVSSVVSALCAPAMLSLESAVETLERNSPNGLLESAFEGASFSTSARYFLASAVSPDLMEDIKLVSALSKEFWLLLEELETDDAESSDNSELVLCIAEIDINVISLPLKFLNATTEQPDVASSYMCGLQSPARTLQGTMRMKFSSSVFELGRKAFREWNPASRRNLHCSAKATGRFPVGSGP